MKPQTLFVNTILILVLAAAALAGLNLGNLGSSPVSPDSTKEAGDPVPTPPQIADPHPAGKQENELGPSGTSVKTSMAGSQSGSGGGVNSTPPASSTDGSSPSSRSSSGPGKRGEVREVRNRVSENLKRTLGEKPQAERGSMSVEAYNRQADSLRKAQQKNLENVIGGS